MRAARTTGRVELSALLFYGFIAAWVLSPILLVAHGGARAHWPGWLTACVAASTGVFCVLVALVLLVVLEPRNFRSRPSRHDGPDGDS